MFLDSILSRAAMSVRGGGCHLCLRGGGEALLFVLFVHKSLDRKEPNLSQSLPTTRFDLNFKIPDFELMP